LKPAIFLIPTPKLELNENALKGLAIVLKATWLPLANHYTIKT
jgi:hypothetical protein